MKYTLVIKQGQDGFLIGQLKELPAVFTQGLTISELKENIAEVLQLYLEDMREMYVPKGVMLDEEEMVFA
jgi:predicted RNase H-like HicB family nuclease